MATLRQNINKPTDEQKSTMGTRHRKKLWELNESCSKLIVHLIILASEQETQVIINLYFFFYQWISPDCFLCYTSDWGMEGSLHTKAERVNSVTLHLLLFSKSTGDFFSTQRETELRCLGNVGSSLFLLCCCSACIIMLSCFLFIKNLLVKRLFPKCISFLKILLVSYEDTTNLAQTHG